MTVKQGTGRPTQGYYAADGKRVPSVTTITGRFKDAGGLIGWAYNRGRDGLPRFDDAADVGTVVHKMVEAFIHGTDAPEVPSEFEERVNSSFSAFREWWEDTKLEIVATELALVSETYRFGGTIDAVARDSKGRLALLDWKSSNGIYEDYLWQVSAYGLLWDETQDEELTGGFRIVRIAKEFGDLDFRHFPTLEDALTTFIHLRRAYDSTKSVKKRAA